MRRLCIHRPEILTRELSQVGVDPNAYPLFIAKSAYGIVKFEGLSCAQANVLKQVALLCGADVAIPKTAYSSSIRKRIPVLLFANRREIEKMRMRLTEQPWMQSITQQLCEILQERPACILKIGKRTIEFTRTYLMGVINITPDSFYSGSRYMTRDTVARVARSIEEEGADFLDIGAESSRPGAEPLDRKEELQRLKHVLPSVARSVRIPISVDTRKADVASFALDNGARIINDISGLSFDKRMAHVIAKNKATIILMHMKGTPKNMQRHPQYDDLMGEIYKYLHEKLETAVTHGIERNRIILDPGLGFGKRLEDNYEIICRFSELTYLNRPLLAGHSRKSFTGKPFDIPPEQRLEATLGLESLLITNGASILRVHDVAEAKKVALLIDTMKR